MKTREDRAQPCTCSPGAVLRTIWPVAMAIGREELDIQTQAVELSFLGESWVHCSLLASGYLKKYPSYISLNLPIHKQLLEILNEMCHRKYIRVMAKTGNQQIL